MTIYVKEMPSLRVNYKGEGKVEKSFYNLLLPHMIEELRNRETDNFVAINCMPGQLLNESVFNEYVNYIKLGLKDNQTEIYFDNVYEGHIHSCLVFIYKIINKLNLNTERCSFISGSLEAQALYDKWCKNYNIINKIKIIVLNSWERHINITTPQQQSDEHKFIIEPKEKKFLCFNRLTRFHRMSVLALLYKENLVKDAFYSFWPNRHWDGFYPVNVDKFNNFVSKKTFDLVIDELKKHEHEMPLLLNNEDSSNVNYVKDNDFDFYRKSYFSLVTETFFFSEIYDAWDETSVFFSEKTYKPIKCKHPFILAARPNSLEYLRKIGYKTFHPYIDESYDCIENDEERLFAIVNEVKRLCNQTENEWIEWLKNVKPIVEENYNTITNKKITEHLFKYE